LGEGECETKTTPQYNTGRLTICQSQKPLKGLLIQI
jgi:hypothetical protein